MLQKATMHLVRRGREPERGNFDHMLAFSDLNPLFSHSNIWSFQLLKKHSVVINITFERLIYS